MGLMAAPRALTVEGPTFLASIPNLQLWPLQYASRFGGLECDGLQADMSFSVRHERADTA